MSATHLPTMNSYRLVWLKTCKNSKTISIIIVEFHSVLICEAGDVSIVIVVETCYIPIVNINLSIWIFFTFRIQTIETSRETVVDDISILRSIVREYEVTCCFEEVWSLAIVTLMHIVGIYIATTLIFSYVDEVHFYHTIDRTIIYLVNNLFVGIIQFLYILNLQGIARGNTYHILCSTLVTLLECCFVFIFVLVDVALFYFKI